jgi:hypothetical protein
MIITRGQDYREIGGWKYQTLRPMSTQSQYRPQGLITSSMGWVQIHSSGALMVRRGYAWDGASGPALDTPSFMRASLFHDALYQLLREGRLADAGGEDRLVADELMRDICRADGMPVWRAWYAYHVLRLAGGRAARRRG